LSLGQTMQQPLPARWWQTNALDAF
jgi:hypothetical protein